MKGLSFDDASENSDSLDNQVENLENIALLKINLYAIFFINLYIIAFVVLIVYCTSCGEKKKEDEVFFKNDWDTDFERNLNEPFDPLIQRSMPSRLPWESREPFDDKWINYKNIYEKT